MMLKGCRLLAAATAASAIFIAPHTAAQQPNSENSEDYREGYRAGYDDGFQRGYQKGLRESGGVAVAPVPAAPPGPPPRSTGPITISRAVYNNGGSRMCDATRWAARMANGRATATLEVSNSMCGDPAPGDRKSLDVTYVCGTIAKTATAYEHRSLYLDCSP